MRYVYDINIDLPHVYAYPCAVGGGPSFAVQVAKLEFGSFLKCRFPTNGRRPFP